LFGSLISATDPVATLAILGSAEVNADPLLYAIVFGESVLNDAVAIVLYKTFETFLDTPFNGSSLLAGIGLFIGISVGSTIIGVGVALICSLVFKNINFNEWPVYEFTLITLFAYMSYFLAEVFHLSGIMSLFFCAIAMAHYNTHNISHDSHHATHIAFKSFAQVCETFVFCYIGITAGLSASPLVYNLSWHVPMVFCTIFSCFIGRFMNVFPLSWILNKYRLLKLPMPMQYCIWFAGLRGAVAFALSLNMHTPGGKYVVTTTLAVVLFTTILMGGLTLPVLRKTNMTGQNLQAVFDQTPILGSEHRQMQKVETTFGERLSSWWQRVDNAYMKRFFGGKKNQRMSGLGALQHSIVPKPEDDGHMSPREVVGVAALANTSVEPIHHEHHSIDTSVNTSAVNSSVELTNQSHEHPDPQNNFIQEDGGGQPRWATMSDDKSVAPGDTSHTQ